MLKKKIALVTVIFLLTAGSVSADQIPVDEGTIAPGGQVKARGESLELYAGSLKLGDDFLALTRSTDMDFPFHHRVTIVSFVPSIDTKVCETQTHVLAEAEHLAPGIDTVTVSRDLPMAQARFANAAEMEAMQFASDYKSGSFGKSAGLMIKGRELLTRGVAVLDAQGIVRYLQIVPELSHLPDMKKAIAFANQLAGEQ